MYRIFNKYDVVLGGEKSDIALDIIQTNTGEYVVAGKTSSQSEGGMDILLLKVGADFKELFKRPFGGGKEDEAHALVQDFDGGYLLAGYGTPRSGFGEKDALLLKTDEQGVPLWTRYFGSEGDDLFSDVERLDDGTFIMTGTKNNQCWILRVDRTGEKILWEYVLDSHKKSVGSGLTRTKDQHFATAGYTYAPQDTTHTDLLVIKIDASGRIVFNKAFESDIAAKSTRIIELEEGALAVIGTSSTKNYREDMCLFVLEQDGQLRFGPRPYGGAGDDTGNAIVQEWDGNLILGGATSSHVANSGRSNLWIRKVDTKKGDSQWSKRAKEDLGYVQNDTCNALLINHQGYLVSAGYSNRPGHGDEVWLLQFDNQPVAKGVTPGQIQTTQAQLYEWDNNGEINPNERCYLGFQLQNTGNEAAHGLYASIRQLQGAGGIQYPARIFIENIRAGARQMVSIPIKGSEDLTADEHLFEIIIRDVFQQPVDSFTLKVRSNKRPEPKLQFSGAGFAGRNNDAVRRGETLRFNFNLENAGNRTADHVTLRLSVSGGIPIQQIAPVPGNMIPYSSQAIWANFTIPADYPTDTLTIFYSAEDERLEFTAHGQYTIVLDEQVFSLPDSLRKQGVQTIFWAPEFWKITNSTIRQKHITAKAVIVSDRPVSLEQITLTKNFSDDIPVPPAGRLVLLQSDDNIFVYQLRFHLPLKIGANVLSLSLQTETQRTISEQFMYNYEALQPNLFLYSIGVPLLEEGAQYNVQNATDFYNFALQNKPNDFFHTIDARLVADTLQTEYYTLRRLLFEIRNRAKQGHYKPEDVLLVYMSAQATDKVRGTFKIKSSDYDGVEVETSAVDFEDFFLYFLDDPVINCRKVLIMDVFGEKEKEVGALEGEGEEKTTLSTSFAGFQDKFKDLITIMSCSPGERSFEDPQWANGALMEAVNTLKEPENLARCDRNVDREITLLEFYNYLRVKTPEIAKKSGKKTQTPAIIQGPSALNDFTLFSY